MNTKAIIFTAVTVASLMTVPLKADEQKQATQPANTATQTAPTNTTNGQPATPTQTGGQPTPAYYIVPQHSSFVVTQPAPVATQPAQVVVTQPAPVATQPAQVVVTQPAPVVVTQPAPVVIQPAPVVPAPVVWAPGIGVHVRGLDVTLSPFGVSFGYYNPCRYYPPFCRPLHPHHKHWWRMYDRPHCR